MHPPCIYGDSGLRCSIEFREKVWGVLLHACGCHWVADRRHPPRPAQQDQPMRAARQGEWRGPKRSDVGNVRQPDLRPIGEAYLNQASDATQPTFLAFLGHAWPLEFRSLWDKSLRLTSLPSEELSPGRTGLKWANLLDVLGRQPTRAARFHAISDFMATEILGWPRLLPG